MIAEESRLVVAINEVVTTCTSIYQMIIMTHPHHRDRYDGHINQYHHDHSHNDRSIHPSISPS